MRFLFNYFDTTKKKENLLIRKEVKPEPDVAFEKRLEYKKVRFFHIVNINNKIHVKEETDLSLTEDLIFK